MSLLIYTLIHVLHLLRNIISWVIHHGTYRIELWGMSSGRSGLRESEHLLAIVIRVEILETIIKLTLIIIIVIVLELLYILRIAISHSVLSINQIIIGLLIYIYIIIKSLESLIFDYWVAWWSLDWGLEMTKIWKTHWLLF
jgi:hypothetical protein